MSQYSSDSEQQASTLAAPGEALRQVRRQKGLSAEQVAVELNVQSSKIEALEQGEYDRLASPVFVRGYLRNYARLVGLDGEALVRQYQGESGEPEPAVPVNDSLNVDMNKRASPWPARIALILVIVACWSAAHWFFVGRDQPPQAAAQSDQAVSSQASSRSSLPWPLDAASEQTQTPSVSDPSPAAPQSSQTALTAEPAEQIEPQADAPGTTAQTAPAADTPASEPAANLDELVLRFDRPCWVEVHDNQGDALAADLQQADSELTLAGRAPFRVKLGEPSGVSITLNGEAVDVPEAPSGAVVTFDVARQRG